ncbi:MAG: YchJ family metal-binding protein [Polyangiaceae bacterium]
MSKSSDCPCHSGLRYSACCEPFHTSTAIAETPEKLMRSRYAAFAKGLGKYLVDTLSASHPDRAHDQKALTIALSRAKESQRFMGLTILEARTDGEHGEVKFHARIFERGRDVSFTEHSTFVKENGSWRYAGVIS